MFGQLAFLIFFIITPKFNSSAKYGPMWATASILTNEIGGSSGRHRHKQCSRVDEKCSTSKQCCRGLVCLQAGYSDGHCIKRSFLQSCIQTNDCPPGSVCETMGLRVDGTTGFCVARLDLERNARGNDYHYGNQLRSGLRSGAGGLSNTAKMSGFVESASSSGFSRNGTLERVEDEVEDARMKGDDLQGMIDRLELFKERGGRGMGSNRRSKVHIPARSVSYLSARNIQPRLSPGQQLLEDLMSPSASFHDSLTPLERYELFCKWLEVNAKVKSTVDMSNRVDLGIEAGFMMDGPPQTRLGQPCQRSQDCQTSDSISRWEICCSRKNIYRLGAKYVCEKTSPMTRCID